MPLASASPQRIMSRDLVLVSQQRNCSLLFVSEISLLLPSLLEPFWKHGLEVKKVPRGVKLSNHMFCRSLVSIISSSMFSSLLSSSTVNVRRIIWQLLAHDLHLVLAGIYAIILA